MAPSSIVKAIHRGGQKDGESKPSMDSWWTGFFHIATGNCFSFLVAKSNLINVGYMWDLIFSDFLGWLCGMFFVGCNYVVNGYLNKVFHYLGLELVVHNVHNYWAARIVDFTALTCLQTWFLSRILLGTWWFILQMASRLSDMGYGWRAIPPLCSLWFCKTYGKWPISKNRSI